MLKIAGERTDGTILWMADEKAIGDHIAPRINAAAEAAGRPAPRVVAGIPVCLCSTSEVDAARERANELLTESEFSPNYQRLLDHGNARDAGDLILAGDEDAIAAGFQRYIDAGVTDISMRLLPIGDTREELRASRDRTREAVAYMAKDLGRSVGSLISPEPFETLARSSHRPRDQEGGRVLWCSSGGREGGCVV